MSDKIQIGTGGVSFTSLLTVLFVALKLTHVIDWSWWWVFAPLWISAMFSIIIILILLVFVWKVLK